MKRNPAGSFIHQSNLLEYFERCCPLAHSWPEHVLEHVAWDEAVREVLSNVLAQPKPHVNGLTPAVLYRSKELRVS